MFGSPRTPITVGPAAGAIVSRPLQAMLMRSRMLSSSRLTLSVAIVATAFLTLRLSLEDSQVTMLVGLLQPATLLIGLALSVIATVSSIASFPLSALSTPADDDTP